MFEKVKAYAPYCILAIGAGLTIESLFVGHGEMSMAVSLAAGFAIFMVEYGMKIVIGVMFTCLAVKAWLELTSN